MARRSNALREPARRQRNQGDTEMTEETKAADGAPAGVSDSTQLLGYPATKIVHWPTGPANCCDEHAKQLVALGKFLGSHVGVTDAAMGAQCKNCEHEAKGE